MEGTRVTLKGILAIVVELRRAGLWLGTVGSWPSHHWALGNSLSLSGLQFLQGQRYRVIL